jgi:Cu/Ag efflux protein CusF
MKTAATLCLVALAISVLLAGCKQDEQKTPEVKQYPIKGKVMSIDTAKPAVKLDHEDIPGLMKGMQMTFDVSDARLLEGLKAGDEVQGQLRVDGDKHVITELKKR